MFGQPNKLVIEVGLEEGFQQHTVPVFCCIYLIHIMYTHVVTHITHCSVPAACYCIYLCEHLCDTHYFIQLWDAYMICIILHPCMSPYLSDANICVYIYLIPVACNPVYLQMLLYTYQYLCYKSVTLSLTLHCFKMSLYCSQTWHSLSRSEQL